MNYQKHYYNTLADWTDCKEEKGLCSAKETKALLFVLKQSPFYNKDDVEDN
jgi:hypothetical protein